MGAIETEIKFRVVDVAALTDQLTGLGFHLVTPRSFESNTLYDTTDRALRAKRQLVRIRSYAGRWVLTHKRAPEPAVAGGDRNSDRHKHRIETETELSDGAALAEVFGAVGLEPVFRYEKWRAEWADATGHCVVDETPLGAFAELEGPDDWIDTIAAQLGIATQDQLTLSYGRLFEQWRAKTGSIVEHLTFDLIRPETQTPRS